MFQDNYKKFITESDLNIAESKQNSALKQNVERYQHNLKQNSNIFLDLELARKRAAQLKYKTINDLEHYLAEFEKKFRNNGGKVIWAEDSEQVIQEILQIIQKQENTKVLYTKSLAAEEINLQKSLSEKEIKTVVSSCIDVILQKTAEENKAFELNLFRKTERNIAETFNKNFNLRKNATSEEIVSYIRETLRNDLLQANISITGADFLVSDCGAIAFSDNEGDTTLAISVPKTHIVVAGIEKIIPSLNDIELMWALKSYYQNGLLSNTYQSIVFGPKKDQETDGCEEMIVILFNNNRTELLRQKPQRQALSCIECGACINVCPVYKKSGTSAYNSVFQGPIGAVVTPFLGDFQEYQHLSFASTLCGKCSEICPVHIPIHELLLYNRKEAIVRKTKSFWERKIFWAIRKVLMSRKYMGIKKLKVKNLALKLVVGSAWSKQREYPKLADKSFYQLWKEQHPE